MLVNVYVDGFNLYYGIKDTSCKWLDIAALCSKMIPGETIHRIRYFTAQVRGTPDDPGKPDRQQVFLRALATIPNLSIHYGFFRRDRARMRLVTPLPDGTDWAEVVKFEEKGSDVNLATWLLVDAFHNEYQLAVVVTNDSDLAEPIRIARQEFGLDVWVLNPHAGRSVSVLRRAASKCTPIMADDVNACSFPEVMRDAWGIITKPPEW